MSESAPIPKMPKHPQSVDDIEIIQAERLRLEAEAMYILRQFFLGNQARINNWMASTHHKNPNKIRYNPNKPRKLAFKGQIPGAALIRPEGAERVHSYVTKHYQGKFDPIEQERPPEGSPYPNLPPPPGERYS